MVKRVARLAARLTEVVLLVLGAVTVVAEDFRFLFWWDVVAAIHLSGNVWRLARTARGGVSAPPRRRLLAGRGGLIFTVLTSLVGIGSGLLIVFGTGDPQDDLSAKVVGVPAVLLAWAILHFGYAERYASAHYDALPDKQFAFPGTDRPTYAAFAYFSFTVGTTFAVSDVETLSTAVRTRVLSHSVLSFLYNTATLGIAIGVITGR
jgi:uncharacterized membrane protein